jgi:hypothetical protein
MIGNRLCVSLLLSACLAACGGGHGATAGNPAIGSSPPMVTATPQTNSSTSSSSKPSSTTTAASTPSSPTSSQPISSGGAVTTHINFGSGAVSVDSIAPTKLAPLPAGSTGNVVSPTPGSGGLSGSTMGQLFGPSAQETAGSFNASGSGSPIAGAFGAKK